MAEYIEREAAYHAFFANDALNGFEKVYCREIIRNIPATYVAPVVHGRWKYFRKKNIAVCTNCSFERDLDANFGNAVCCPNCGAKMDGGHDV